ncbi:collagen alpha-2(VIII) chain-like [Sarcophilus harrisii]|uniref:collagen alpha-2(VIII) chain-like n=1 Tax=Sarcophilus harrisii TaxID=9305 RepID=UPI001301CB1A|nr:collagen alpha-2(VIII) chain-like [Sarcophilus harrisii]
MEGSGAERRGAPGAGAPRGRPVARARVGAARGARCGTALRAAPAPSRELRELLHPPPPERAAESRTRSCQKLLQGQLPQKVPGCASGPGRAAWKRRRRRCSPWSRAPSARLPLPLSLVNDRLAPPSLPPSPGGLRAPRSSSAGGRPGRPFQPSEAKFCDARALVRKAVSALQNFVSGGCTAPAPNGSCRWTRRDGRPGGGGCGDRDRAETPPPPPPGAGNANSRRAPDGWGGAARAGTARKPPPSPPALGTRTPRRALRPPPGAPLGRERKQPVWARWGFLRECPGAVGTRGGLLAPGPGRPPAGKELLRRSPGKSPSVPRLTWAGSRTCRRPPKEPDALRDLASEAEPPREPLPAVRLQKLIGGGSGLFRALPPPLPLPERAAPGPRVGNGLSPSCWNTRPLPPRGRKLGGAGGESVPGRPLGPGLWGPASGARPLGPGLWGPASGARPLGPGLWGPASGLCRVLQGRP